MARTRTPGVIQGADGHLYGTTTNGGAFGYGTVFVMNLTGGLTTVARHSGKALDVEYASTDDGARA